MHIKGKYTWLKHLDFMLVDLFALAIAFAASYYLKFQKLDFVGNERWIRLLIIVLLLNIVISLFVNPYSGIFRRSYYQEVIRALQLTIYNFLATGIMFYLLKIGVYYSRGMFISMYIIYFVLSLLMKYIWKKLIVSRRIVLYTTRRAPLFIVGDKENIRRVIGNALAGDFVLYDVRGIHLIDDSSCKELDSYPVLGEDYIQYILDNNINEVFVAVPPSELATKDYERLVANGVVVNINIESAIGMQTEEQLITNLGVYKTLSIGAFSFTPGQMIYLMIKRVFDIMCGIIGVIVLIPITLLVKLSYMISGDFASVFYRQTRVGMDGKLIRIFKFRSMVTNADEILKELLKDEKYRREWEENQKFSNDPRITKAGRILRKTSIDEFPQFLNVLKGDMSLVGPRPLVVGELEAHGGLKLYEKVKPGITGWWGCNGRSNIDYRERLELEYYYVKNCSLYLDVLCVFRTILAVLKKDGAQ